jgi:drug/metabolite transporter (DMT)-like permease
VINDRDVFHHVPNFVDEGGAESLAGTITSRHSTPEVPHPKHPPDKWDAVKRVARVRGPLLIGGLGSGGTYMIVLAATRLAPVSYVVPMRETSIVIGAVLGSKVLGETLGASRLRACALVVAGVIAIGIGG